MLDEKPYPQIFPRRFDSPPRTTCHWKKGEMRIEPEEYLPDASAARPFECADDPVGKDAREDSSQQGEGPEQGEEGPEGRGAEQEAG